MIRGILFDFDGVLTKRYVSAYHMYCWIVDSVQGDSVNSLLKEEIVQRCMLWDQFGYCDKSYVLENMKKNWFPEMNVTFWKNKWYEKFDTFQVLSDSVEEVLKELKKHYLLGVLSNGSSKSQHAKLHHTGLEKYFDCVIVSGDYGIDKPNPEIFQIACDKLGTKQNETAMVGDTFLRISVVQSKLA